MEVELVELKVPMYVYLDGISLKRTWGGEVRNISVFVADDGFAQKTAKPHFCYQKTQLSCSKMGLRKKLSIFSIFHLTVLRFFVKWSMRNRVREVMEKISFLFDLRLLGTRVTPLWRQHRYCVGIFLEGSS